MNIVLELRKLRHREHACTVEIISMLVQCQAQKLYLDHGCPTMWEFLVRELKYSNAAASRRYKAMKCVAKFPRALEMLRTHEITLSTLAQAESMLGEVSDPAEFLDRISGKSHREVEKIVARARPVPQRPREVVRAVAVRAAPDPLFADAPSVPVEERVSLRTSLSQKQYEKFERARAIVSRKNPAARVEDVLIELLDFYLAKKAPRKRKPAKAQPTRTRHIPAATRDEVMLRDDERCTYVGQTGRRCNSRHNLQIDHIQPWARGGGHEAENLRVLCAAHNQHEARRWFSSVPAPEVKERRGRYVVNARVVDVQPWRAVADQAGVHQAEDIPPCLRR